MMNSQHNKGIYALVGGALVTIGAWALEEFAGVRVPAEVAGAAVTVVSAGLAWIIPNKEVA